MKYLPTTLRMTLVAALLAILYGCDSGALDETEHESAQILGNIETSGAAAGKSAGIDLCPEVIISINDVPANVEFLEDDGCSFFISAVPVADEVSISVDFVEAGLTGIIIVQDVHADELIELLVEVDEDALALSILRRVPPLPDGDLPFRITENNIEISLGPDFFDQDLTVDGNKVTLTGVAGASCSSDDWTTITGDVIVRGNKAVFRNIKFLSGVTVTGNKASFINTCFGDALVSFGAHPDDDRFGDDDDDDD